MKGCLENIPPKTGTSRNESLHWQLNNIINIPKCSVELIVSILVSFFMNGMLTIPFVPFHSYQNMKKGKVFWSIWDWHISHRNCGYWRKWQTSNNKWKQHIDFNIRSNKYGTRTIKCVNCNLQNQRGTGKRINSWNDWSSQIITESNSTTSCFY